VGAGARLLAGRAGRYVFVSSVNAHPGWPEEVVSERSELHPCPPDAGPQDGDYGELKAGCERAVADAFGDACLIVRAGTLVGPHENVGRLPAWIERAERGGPLVVPGPPDRPLQLLDARDLAAWMLEPDRTGAYVCVGETVSMRDLVEALASAAPVWAGDDDLVSAGFEPWTEIPFWLPESEGPGTMRVDGRTAGLRSRPLAETVADTRRWLLEEGGRAELAALGPHPRGGVRIPSPERERALALRLGWND
jgi:nucleoside-diphosphate-sugar epimerase